MKIYGFLISIVLAAAVIKESAAETDYEANTVLYGFKDSFADPFIMKLDEKAEDVGCAPTANVSVVVHGWLEGLNTTKWVNETVVNLLKYRTGCVFFFDYSQYSKISDYNQLVPHYEKLAEVLTKYLQNIGNPERIFMYGFSFGARLSVEAAIASYNGSIDRIDLCDPIGLGFDGTPKAKVPTLAAQNVACIDTSSNYGTGVYNCHQNFRMGACGTAQAAHGSYPKGSHTLCPEFYNVAFKFDFIPYDHYAYRCGSARLAKLTPEVKMGFLGISYMNKTEIRGDIFIATSGHWPYVAVDPRHLYFNATKMAPMMVNFENLQFSRRDDPLDVSMMTMRENLWNTSLDMLKALQEFTDLMSKSVPYQFDSNELFSYDKQQNPPKLALPKEFNEDNDNLLV